MQTNPISSDKDDFETLLNLLASDGIDDLPNEITTDLGTRSRTNETGRGNKLDLNKIRSFYQQSNYRTSGEGSLFHKTYVDQPIETTRPEAQGSHDGHDTDQFVSLNHSLSCSGTIFLSIQQTDVLDSTLGNISRSLPDVDSDPFQHSDDGVAQDGSIPRHFEVRIIGDWQDHVAQHIFLY
jgi:hypothetical protein